MGFTCQYDLLKFSGFTNDIIRYVTAEGELQLSDNLPRLKGIIGGDFKVEPVNLSINDDYLVVTGRIHPRLNYFAPVETQPVSKDSRDEEEVSTVDGEMTLRSEYGSEWTGEAGLFFSEQIVVPGLKPGMPVSVDVLPIDSQFQILTDDKLGFSGQMQLVIHLAVPQEVPVIGGINTPTPEQYQVIKEQTKVQEILGYRRAVASVQTPLLLSNLKPGVSRIISYTVKPSGVTTETSRGMVVTRGYLNVALVYVGCDDEGRQTEVFVQEWSRDYGNGVPFELTTEGQGDELIVSPRVMVKDCNLELISQRELRCYADLEAEIMLSQVVTKEIVVDVTANVNETIDSQKMMLNYEEYIGEANGEIQLQLPITFAPGQLNLERILSWDGDLVDVQAEAGENKVLVEGLLDLSVLYMADNGEESRLAVARWNKQNGNAIQVAGVIDFPGLPAGSLVNTRVALENLKLEAAADQGLQLMASVKLTAWGRAPRSLFILKDSAPVAPVDPSTRPSMLFYVIQPGDTLWKIARHYQTTVDTLTRINQIPNSEQIFVGQKILIPKQII